MVRIMIYRFKIPCSKDSLKAIRSFVNETLSGFAVPELEANLLVLAVDEICANRIIHSNNNDQSMYVEVVIKKEDNDDIIFEIIDAGTPFDNTSYKEPNLVHLIQERRKGGLGLMLVNRIMDAIEVTTVGDLSVFRMYKKLSLAS